MYKLIKYYLVRPFLIWLLVFQVFKSFFVLYHYNLVSTEAFFHVFKVFTQGIKLDISSASYLMIIPFLLMLWQYYHMSALPKKILKYYIYCFLLFVSVLNVVDIIIYNYWTSKISLKSLMFLAMPDQVLAATGLTNFIMGVFLVLLHFFIAKYLFDKFLLNKKLRFSKSLFAFIIFSLISAAGIIVGIRGGFQQIPINQSVAYYSSNSTLNIAGVNPLWNFMNTLVQNKKYLNVNPYHKIENAKADELVNTLFKVEKDTSVFLFKNEKPNIVFITLEGVNANVFKTFGSELDYTPNMDSLFGTGFLFKNMYAAGFRSDQGLIAMLGGFPPTPVSSIASQPEKFSKLPSLVSKLKTLNYETSFYTGVEAEFGNLKSYLVSNAFDKIVDVKDFPSEQKTQNLGVPDAFLFDKYSKALKQMEQPFFSMVFTSTTHEPYDMPFNEGVADESLRYLNTVKYLDSVLIHNISKWKEMPWYENTVFVLTSDHAHFHPGNYVVDENKRYEIPFFIFGPALKNEFVGKTNEKIFSQVDIPKTISAQLGTKHDDFIWSKDMMNPYVKPFAFYTYVEGCVLKTDNCNHGWEYRYDKPYGYAKQNNADECVVQSQALLQKLYDKYLEY